MEENAQSVKNTHDFLLLMHTIIIGVNWVIGSISQDKQVINTSKYTVKIRIKAGITKNSLNVQNKTNQSNNYNSIHKIHK